jgi:DNA-directed RNA polymerase specialized sigma24 family protein
VLPEPAAAGRGPEALATDRETAAELAAHLSALPDRYRIAVVLRHVDGLTYAEMAEALERPEGTLKAQVHRGLGLLRAAIEADQRARTAGARTTEATRDAGRPRHLSLTPEASS